MLPLDPLVKIGTRLAYPNKGCGDFLLMKVIINSLGSCLRLPDIGTSIL